MAKFNTMMWVAANAISFGVVCALLMVATFFGPRIETAIWPIISFPAPTDNKYRDQQKACFDLHIHKNSSGRPLKYEFFVEVKLSAFIPVAAYIADAHHFAASSDLENHPVGTTWIRHYCFELPSTLADQQPFRVSGDAQHERHPLWTTVTPIPDFVVKPLGQAQD